MTAVTQDLDVAAVSPPVLGVPVPRPAGLADMPAVCDIYASHVRHGTGTFDEEPPDLASMTGRFDASRSRNLPFLVAEAGSGIAGFAYASLLRPRSAYRFTVEDSVYVHPDMVGRGLGRLLLQALITECEAMGCRQMVAVIGDSANHRSIRLHASLGFCQTGTLAAVGFKFGRWLDVVFMQRALGRGHEDVPQR